MRRGKHRKFGREKDLRNVLYKSLATALVEHGKIKTTEAKAKSLSSYISQIITTSKKDNLSARKQLLASLSEKAVKKIFNDLTPKFKDQNGGYVRITRLGQRRSDGAPMAQVEFVK